MVLTVFANTLDNEFVYDDSLRIVPDRLHSWQAILRLRGLTYATQVLDKGLWGTWAPGFHLTNLLLHAIASSLAFYAALSLSRSRCLGLLTGLFFAVHPVHVDAVASFVNRKDILAMIFVCLALILWRNTRFPVLGYMGSWICYGLGFLAKEVAVIGLGPMLFLADLFLRPGSDFSWRTRLRRATLRSLPLLLMGVAVALWSVGDLPRLFTSESIDRVTETQLQSYGQVFVNTAAAVPEQFRLLFWPLKLSADYPPWPEMTATHPRVLLGLGIALLWVGTAIRLIKRRPLMSLAMVWTWVMYLPSSNLVPLAHFFVAERYLYVPSFGICLVVALGLERWFARAAGSPQPAQRAAVVCVALVLLSFGAVRSFVCNQDWQDSYSLWSSTVRAGYETARAHHNLGSFFLNQGDYREAVSHFERSLEKIPGNRVAETIISDLTARLRVAQTQQNLGSFFLNRGDYGRAAEHFRESLKSIPKRIVVEMKLVAALMRLGRLEEAATVCWQVLSREPQHAGCLYTLGEIHVQKGNRPEAIKLYQALLAAPPNHLGALCDLALLRATPPETELRDGREAVRLSQRAHQLTDGNDPQVMLNLALSYAAAGDLTTAREWGERAYNAALAQGQDKLAGRIKADLRRFRVGG